MFLSIPHKPLNNKRIESKMIDFPVPFSPVIIVTGIFLFSSRSNGNSKCKSLNGPTFTNSNFLIFIY